MLDTLKGLTGGGKGKKQAAALQALIAAAHEERGALSAMLTQISIRGAKLAHMDKALEHVEQRAERATAAVAELTNQVTALGERLSVLGSADERLETLLARVRDVQAAAHRLSGSDSEMQQHRDAIADLTAQAHETQAAIAALRQERVLLDDLRAQLRQVIGQVKQSIDGSARLEGEFASLRTPGLPR